MIVTTEAVVLRAMKFRDTSKIVSLYTRQFGRLSVVAKGARGRTPRFGAALEPMSHVTAVLYHKERRELHLLSQCDLLNGFRRIADTMERMAAGLEVVELVGGVTHDEEANPALFDLLTATLGAIDHATNTPALALYSFEIRLAAILGFQTAFAHCLVCARPLEGTAVKGGVSMFQPDRGGCLCSSCRESHPGGRRLGAAALEVMQQLEDAPDPAAALKIAVAPAAAAEVGETLSLYLRTHVEGLRDSRAERVFAALR